IAVVASEPLATLVVCVVTGCRPDFAPTCFGHKPPPAFETFRVNGTLPVLPEAESSHNGPKPNAGRGPQ
ncbi:MAG: hypothetical protein ACE5KM_21855, partial [Planctomycetaceae bacterium]